VRSERFGRDGRVDALFHAEQKVTAGDACGRAAEAEDGLQIVDPESTRRQHVEIRDSIQHLGDGRVDALRHVTALRGTLHHRVEAFAGSEDFVDRRRAHSLGRLRRQSHHTAQPTSSPATSIVDTRCATASRACGSHVLATGSMPSAPVLQTRRTTSVARTLKRIGNLVARGAGWTLHRACSCIGSADRVPA